MRVLKKICDGIGVVSEWSGRVVMFLVVVLIVSIAYDVFARYLFNSPTVWSYTLSYMLGTSIIAIGLPYVYYHNANVRVDVIYSKLPPRGRLILDVVLTIFLFFPMVFLLIKVFGEDLWQAYLCGEVATDSIWYPILWPFKLVVTLGFVLLFLQGIATFIGDLERLFKGGTKA
ncbi:MAG: TRAP transporter small permease subunit [Dehalococcoidia bacterium]|nr:TRAP transporter small permease subunit [Dehalococcoidia bacterium]